MPIVIRIDRLLLERRMTLTELADRVGITLANLSILKTNKARAVRFSTLEALCRELGCQPSDILEFIPDVEPKPDAAPMAIDPPQIEIETRIALPDAEPARGEDNDGSTEQTA